VSSTDERLPPAGEEAAVAPVLWLVDEVAELAPVVSLSAARARRVRSVLAEGRRVWRGGGGDVA
jgi:hypothetical protein